MSLPAAEVARVQPRVLHLFANYKWTGPADPAIRTAATCRELGVDARFAQAGWTLPGAEHRMAKELWNRRVPVLTGMWLRKHFRIPATRHDARMLARLVARDGYTMLHSHLLGDHLPAAFALGQLRRGGAPRPRLVRTLYDPDPPARGWRQRLAFGRTDGVVTPTRSVAEAMVRRFGLPPERVVHLEPTTDPVDQRPTGDLRASWGVSEDAVLIGITARIQPHRRFELLWQVARQVVDAAPTVRIVLLGRGNAVDTEALVRRPVAELGLQDHVILPGYQYEPDYSRALRSLDGFLFLVPGSDGTCRAVREAMAFGLPVLATPRGILPELVLGDGSSSAKAGAISEETPEAMAARLLEWVRDPDERRRLGDQAAARARNDMDPRSVAMRLLGFYERLAALPPRWRP